MPAPDAPPETPLGGVLETCLYADDLTAAETFYRDVLGLEFVTRAPGRHVFFRCQGQMVFLFAPAATETTSPDAPFPVPPHGARGPGHLCFWSDAAGVAAWRARLEATGVAIEADFHWPNGARSVYFRDPAGNSLEIAERRLWFGD